MAWVSEIDALAQVDDGVVMLAVIDPWDWGDVEDHLEVTQEKINNYLAALESGQVSESVPGFIPGDSPFVIWYMLENEEFPDAAGQFFARLRFQLSQFGGDLRVWIGGSFEDGVEVVFGGVA